MMQAQTGQTPFVITWPDYYSARNYCLRV